MQPQDEWPESQAYPRPWWELDFSDYLSDEDLAAGYLDSPPLYLAKYYAEFPEQDL